MNIILLISFNLFLSMYLYSLNFSFKVFKFVIDQSSDHHKVILSLLIVVLALIALLLLLHLRHLLAHLLHLLLLLLSNVIRPHVVVVAPEA